MTKDLEARVAAIEERNSRVVQDKNWETSWTRRMSIAVLTYAVVALYLLAIDNSAPFVNAFVPAVGFVLSNLVLKNVRDVWNRRNR